MAKIEMTETLKSILEDAIKMYAEDPIKVEYIQSILTESGTAADLTDKNKNILKLTNKLKRVFNRSTKPELLFKE